jgi:hypothetical protein
MGESERWRDLRADEIADRRFGHRPLPMNPRGESGNLHPRVLLSLEIDFYNITA